MIFSFPAVGNYTARKLSLLLTKKLETPCHFDKVKIQSFNKIELQNVWILDQKSDTLLKANNIGAKILLRKLINNHLHISTLNIVGLDGRINKRTKESKANYEFILDRLSPKESDTKSETDFIVNTLILRDAKVTYDIIDQLEKPRQINPSHLCITDMNGNLSINKVAKDSLNIRIRNFDFKEKSGLVVSKLSSYLIAGPQTTQLRNFELRTPESFIKTNNIIATNTVKNKELNFLNNSFKNVKLNGRISPKDMAIFYPSFEKLGVSPYSLEAVVEKEREIIQVYSTLTHLQEKDFFLNAQTTFDLNQLLKKHPVISSNIHELTIDAKQIESLFAAIQPQAKLPDFIDKIGILKQDGLLSVNGANYSWKGHTSTALGQLEEKIQYEDQRLEATFDLDNINIGEIISSNEKMFGTVSGIVALDGFLGNRLALNVKSHLTDLGLNNYHYNQIALNGKLDRLSFEGQLKVEDPNLSANLTGNVMYSKGIDLIKAQTEIERLNLQALHLTEKYGNTDISGSLTAQLNTKSPTPTGNLVLRKIKMKDETGTYAFDSLQIQSLASANNQLRTYIRSDMLEARYTGNVAWQEVPAYFYNQLTKRIEALPHLFKYKLNEGKYADLDLRLKKTAFLEHVFGLPLKFEEMPNLSAHFNTDKRLIKVAAYLPTFYLNDSKYEAGTLYLNTEADSLKLLSQITKQFGTDDLVKFVLNSSARNNVITSQIDWKTVNDSGTSGTLKTKSSFGLEINGTPSAFIQLYPSKIFVTDSLWQVNPSSFEYKNGNYRINDFMISHKNQFIKVNTSPDSISDGKGLIAQLNDIDLEYIFDLLNFHPVEFAGKASGEVITNNLSEDKDINAYLTVRDFKFNTGDMGTLHLDGQWLNDSKLITIDAMTQQQKNVDSTFIRGYVDVGNDQINLNFNSVKTNLEFLNQYLSGIMGNLHGRTTGKLRLSGPLDAMNLDGKEFIESLSFMPRALNTNFYITNDSMTFVPGKFIFNNVTIKDEKGNSATVNGDVHHRVLHDFGFDLNIDAHNLLAFDWNEWETNSFWGTVYADGTCRLWGDTDALHVDVNATPRANTKFVYDSSAPGETDNKEFINFTSDFQPSQKKEQNKKDEDDEDNSRKDSSTDIYLDFKINATPDANLVILTDKKTGDNMSLTGSGPLHINYFNKGRFNMFGTYTVNEGQYKITMRDIIRKNFEMQKGGVIRFNGSPMDGELDLKGIYPIKSVSLADLNLGNLKSTSADVDCILFFKGRAGAPEVSFDLAFPNVNGDEEQMVRNMIASQGDMNMQIIYLLSIGRFFTYDYSNYNMGSDQNQSTVAMKSLLANTLSGQFNSMLSNALNVRNWKFGTNISTGRIGWSDMEVEGLLSGNLLNNRLLINGNFGYRDQTYYANNFVGDFNIRWLLTKSGVISLKAYSETNDRYFTKTSLTTNGIGLLFQRDFDTLRDFFKIRKKKPKK